MEDKVYTPEEIAGFKKKIDSMSRYDMCYIWRFGISGDPYLDSRVVGDYFKNRLFNELGGFSTEISKELGWEK